METKNTKAMIGKAVGHFSCQVIAAFRPVRQVALALTLDCREAAGTVLKQASLCGLPAFMSPAGGFNAQHFTLGIGGAAATVLKQNAFCGPSAFMNNPAQGGAWPEWDLLKSSTQS